LVNLWPWFRSRASARHAVLKRNEECFAGFDPSRPIEDYEFVCFDTELTGLNPRRDEIVSIGAVRIRELRIVAGDNFFSYIQPNQNIPKNSTLIHRITPEQIKSAPMPEVILPEFVDFCGNALLIGHFVALDMAFVNKALRKHLGGAMCNPRLDSVRLAEAYHEHKGKQGRVGTKTELSYNLTKLALEYNLPMFEQHDALEDALQTAYLFLFLAKNLRAAGYGTLKEFFAAGRTAPSVFQS
jgi:DNA polymerase III subunit epsilon